MGMDPDREPWEAAIQAFGEVLSEWRWYTRTKAEREAQVNEQQAARERMWKRIGEIRGRNPEEKRNEPPEDSPRKTIAPPPWREAKERRPERPQPDERSTSLDTIDSTVLTDPDPWHNPDPTVYKPPFDLARKLHQAALRTIREAKEAARGLGNDGAQSRSFCDLVEALQEAAKRFRERHQIPAPEGVEHILQLYRVSFERTLNCDLDQWEGQRWRREEALAKAEGAVYFGADDWPLVIDWAAVVASLLLAESREEMADEMVAWQLCWSAGSRGRRRGRKPLDRDAIRDLRAERHRWMGELRTRYCAARDRSLRVDPHLIRLGHFPNRRAYERWWNGHGSNEYAEKLQGMNPDEVDALRKYGLLPKELVAS